MSLVSVSRKPLGVRATHEQHKLLSEAAGRANRSISSFVLTAALEAAASGKLKPRKSVEEIRAILRSAREEIQAHNPTNRNLEEELFAERRAEAARD